ncbi:MAG: DUF2269 family protein [Sphingomicrobium sp.]
MEAYFLLKTFHIISAAVLFGTGLGIAFFFWRGGRNGNGREALFAAKATVIADFLFTATAVVAQPLTGALLVWQGGFDPLDHWLVMTYALYGLAGICWIPVVVLQIRIRNALQRKADGGPFDAAAVRRMRALWFMLGWPAFLGLLVVFHLMVTKPS